MREFLFFRSTWLVETISQLMAATVRVTTDESERDSVVDASDDDASVDDAEEESEGMEDKKEVVYVSPTTGELTQLKKQINDNVALHQMPHLNTHVHSSRTCHIRLLVLAMEIHDCHEMHSIILQTDGVGEVGTR